MMPENMNETIRDKTELAWATYFRTIVQRYANPRAVIEDFLNYCDRQEKKLFERLKK